MGIQFFSGSHPAEHKETTRRKPVALPDRPPEHVTLALRGRACLVKPGQRVFLGEPVARPEREEDVVLHASVSGTVEQVTENAVTLKNDGKDTPFPGCAPWEGPEPGARELADRLREYGVVGLASGGGEGIHKKLMLAAAAPVDTLILNGVECDSWHTADHRLMVEQAERVVEGARLLRSALRLPKAVIAVAGDKMDAVEALEALTDGDEGLTVKVLRSRYPLGEERILTGLLTGRRVPPHGDPIAVGCVVFSVATAAAVYDAVRLGRPLTHRIVTVTGTAVVKPRNLWVPMGVSAQELIRSTDGLRPGGVRGWVGSPMRGVPLQGADTVVEPGTAAIVLLRSVAAQREPEERICIRCGKCVSACPMRLLPLYAGTGLEGEPGDCVGCGACSAVCPSLIPLRERMQRGKEKTR